MKVALVHHCKLPVYGYGGTERVIWWLAKGLYELGVKVTLACKKGSHCPFAEVFPVGATSVETQLRGVQLFHYFSTPSRLPQNPYLVTIGGNGKLGELFLPNTVFVSRNHAERHHADCYVYNGLDPTEYQYCNKKERYLVFLSKASWRVKNVRGAIQMARKSHLPLRILGGSRFFLKVWRGVHWEGTVGGKKKSQLLSQAMALLFPVIWNEPFGIAVVEALVSGTPVVASKRGSLPELVGQDVGRLCESEEDFLTSLSEIETIRPELCRDWALDRFHYQSMARKYLELYERVLEGESLNRSCPTASEPPEKIYPLSSHTQ